MKATINSVIWADLVYQKASAQFHQWTDQQTYSWGLNFASGQVAETFATGMARALQALKGGYRAAPLTMGGGGGGPPRAPAMPGGGAVTINDAPAADLDSVASVANFFQGGIVGDDWDSVHIREMAAGDPASTRDKCDECKTKGALTWIVASTAGVLYGFCGTCATARLEWNAGVLEPREGRYRTSLCPLHGCSVASRPCEVTNCIRCEKKEAARYWWCDLCHIVWSSYPDDMVRPALCKSCFTADVASPRRQPLPKIDELKRMRRLADKMVDGTFNKVAFYRSANGCVRMLAITDSGSSLRKNVSAFDFSDPSRRPEKTKLRANVGKVEAVNEFFKVLLQEAQLQVRACVLPTPPALERCRALFDYEAQDDAEISFKGGDIMIVLHKDESGWWQCQNRAQTGLAPSNFCELLPESAPVAAGLAGGASALSAGYVQTQPGYAKQGVGGGEPLVARAVISNSATQVVGGLQWVAQQVQSLSDEDREQAREWLMKTFKTSTSVALQAMGAVDEIVAAAKVVTVVLRVAMAIAEAHERAKANDGRVAHLCARLNELRVIMEQMRDSLAEQAANVVSGKTATSTASALRTPLDRLLNAVKAARDAIDAWQEVSRATGADKWAKFKRWTGRVVKSSAHADTLVEANDELQSALQQIGAVASIRAALNTAGGANDDLKAWLKQNAERDDVFRTALQQDTSEIKQKLANLLPDIDKLLTRHLSGMNEKLDHLLGANIEKLPFELFERQSERTLGEGAYGAIVAMKCKKLGSRPIAVKILVLSGNAAEDKKRKERLREEARLMNQFKHQHIVQFYGQVVTPTNELWLVMELLDKSLEKFIAVLAGDQSKWPMDDRKRVGHEIALGLEYLHGKNVLHRDLKSPNVMLTAVERQAKLIDFGLSKDTNSAKNKSSTIQGSSSLWMAPEINGNDDFSQASDVYAFGIVLTEIVLLELPSMSTLRKVSKMTGEWKALIDKCTEEPSDRPTAAQCAEKLNF